MLVIDSADIPPPEDPDEFYDHQLIGLAVVTVDGEPVGEVADVLHHGQDLLVVRRGKARRLVPFVKALVPEVDLDRRQARRRPAGRAARPGCGRLTCASTSSRSSPSTSPRSTSP